MIYYANRREYTVYRERDSRKETLSKSLSLPVMATKLIVPVDMLVFHYETFIPRPVFGYLGDLVMSNVSYHAASLSLCFKTLFCRTLYRLLHPFAKFCVSNTVCMKRRLLRRLLRPMLETKYVGDEFDVFNQHTKPHQHKDLVTNKL